MVAAEEFVVTRVMALRQKSFVVARRRGEAATSRQKNCCAKPRMIDDSPLDIDVSLL